MSPVLPLFRFRRLSLDKVMGPVTRSQVRREASRGDGLSTALGTRQDSPSDEEASNFSLDEEDEEDEEDYTRTVVRSPATRISYDISDLDPETQSEVRQLFRETHASEPPSLALQWCQLNQEEQVYAFQLHEVVPRSIRIGSSTSKYSTPRCNCMTDIDKPCKHLIYLLDQLNYLSSDNLLDEPVQKLGPRGPTTGAGGQPFEKISKFHLDLLASNLHCGVGSPDSRAEFDSVRLEETREILATVATTPDPDDHAVQHFRPDLFESRDTLLLEQHGIVSPGDLTKTVAGMLLTNDDFFAYFLRLLGPTSKARDPFRKIQQHVDRVLRALDAAARHPPGQQPTATQGAAEGPRDVPWAAAHVDRAVATIQYLLQNRDDAPSPAERASAARALVRILHAVVLNWNRTIPPLSPLPYSPSQPGASSSGTGAILPDRDNNLYQRLIGSRTIITTTTKSPTPFVLGTLAQLPEQNQWIETLEDIEARLTAHGAPVEYARRLRDLIALMRSSRPPAPSAPPSRAAGSKRSASSSGGDVKEGEEEEEESSQRGRAKRARG